MHDMETKLRKAAKDLLESGKVETVVGFQNGSLPLRTRPHFVRDASVADTLVWNRFCTNNLAAYLPRLFEKPASVRGQWSPPKIAVAAKGCDARSIIGLIKEHQVPRGSVVIIAMPCQGMVDPRKADAAAGEAVTDCHAGADGAFEVTTVSGRTRTLQRDQVVAEACLGCLHPAPAIADVKVEGPSQAPAAERFARAREFEAMAPAQRWELFLKEIAKCIRCYACRQACPNCYCKSCFIEQSKPNWAGAGDDPSDLLLFHIGRMFHQAGRCVECDACVRACPMHIDLRLFTQKLVKDVEELFGYVPGASLDDMPPLCAFQSDDSESFITHP
ncbi:MAG: 4Fe-4S ferredoxin [Phycisphaerae bacterium]|jgi:ferredoxin